LRRNELVEALSEAKGLKQSDLEGHPLHHQDTSLSEVHFEALVTLPKRPVPFILQRWHHKVYDAESEHLLERHVASR